MASQRSDTDPLLMLGPPPYLWGSLSYAVQIRLSLRFVADPNLSSPAISGTDASVLHWCTCIFFHRWIPSVLAQTSEILNSFTTDIL